MCVFFQCLWGDTTCNHASPKSKTFDVEILLSKPLRMRYNNKYFNAKKKRIEKLII